MKAILRIGASGFLAIFLCLTAVGCQRSQELQLQSNKGQDESSTAEYKLGSPVTFGISGNTPSYQVSGWSFPESKMTWPDGLKAALKIPLPVAGRVWN